MPLVAPAPFHIPSIGPKGPGGIWDDMTSMTMSCDIFEVVHSTAAASPAACTFTNLGIINVTGTQDRSLPGGGLQPGDMIIAITEDTATGATATFTPGTNITTNTIEGATSGVFATAAFAGTSSNADLVYNPGLAGGTKIISVWSTVVGLFSAQKFAGSIAGPAIAVVTATAGTAGTRRTQIYVARPRFGYSIPNRGYRLVATGTESGVQNTAVVVNVPMTWTYSRVRTGGLAMVVAAFADAGSSGISVDADNDSALELTADDYAMSGSETTLSKGYGPGDPHRPGTQVNVSYLANPGANGHATAVVIYALEPDTFLQGGKNVGFAMKATANPSGGPNTPPGTRHAWLAMKASGWPRSKYPPKANHNVGVAFSAKGNPRVQKMGSGSVSLVMDAVGNPFKPLIVNRPELLVPPGKFGAPSQNIFGQSYPDIAGMVFKADGDTASGTDAVSSVVTTTFITDGDTASGIEGQTIRLAGSDTAVGSEGALISLTDADMGAGAEGTAVALSNADTAVGTDATSTVSLAGTDTATGTDANPSITLSGSDSGTGADVGSVNGNANVSDGDTATGTEGQSIKLTGADTATGTEAATSVKLNTSDTGTGADAVAISVHVTGSDGGFFTDGQSVNTGANGIPVAAVLSVGGQWSATCSVGGQWSAVVEVASHYQAEVTVL